MLKFLLIFFIIFYLVFKVGGFLVRLFLGNLVKQNRQQTYQYDTAQKKQPRDGNVHIDYIPEEGQDKEPKEYKGGDYIDYEEVK